MVQQSLVWYVLVLATRIFAFWYTVARCLYWLLERDKGGRTKLKRNLGKPYPSMFEHEKLHDFLNAAMWFSFLAELGSSSDNTWVPQHPVHSNPSLVIQQWIKRKNRKTAFVTTIPMHLDAFGRFPRGIITCHGGLERELLFFKVEVRQEDGSELSDDAKQAQELIQACKVDSQMTLISWKCCFATPLIQTWLMRSVPFCCTPVPAAWKLSARAETDQVGNIVEREVMQKSLACCLRLRLIMTLRPYIMAQRSFTTHHLLWQPDFFFGHVQVVSLLGQGQIKMLSQRHNGIAALQFRVAIWKLCSCFLTLEPEKTRFLQSTWLDSVTFGRGSCGHLKVTQLLVEAGANLKTPALDTGDHWHFSKATLELLRMPDAGNSKHHQKTASDQDAGKMVLMFKQAIWCLVIENHHCLKVHVAVDILSNQDTSTKLSDPKI